MADLPLDAARTILDATLAQGRRLACKPLAVAVFDARGALKAFAAEDGTSLKRGDMAEAKALGALGLGFGTREIARRAREHPAFIAALGPIFGGALLPSAGGVLIRTADGVLVGAIGVSGDTSDKDEAAALVGIHAAGYAGDPGAD